MIHIALFNHSSVIEEKTFLNQKKLIVSAFKYKFSPLIKTKNGKTKKLAYCTY